MPSLKSTDMSGLSKEEGAVSMRRARHTRSTGAKTSASAEPGGFACVYMESWLICACLKSSVHNVAFQVLLFKKML